MPKSLILSSVVRATDIRVAHDPLSIDTLLVWLKLDTELANFSRPQYGDPFPGFVDPKTKQTLYSDYVVCNIRELDAQYIEVCYRLLPSSQSFYYKWQSYTDIPFPDTLASVSVSFNSNQSNGSSSHPSTQQAATATGSHGTVSANPRASAESGAAIIPEITPVITSINGRNLEMTNLSFEMSSGASMNDILLRATAIMGIAAQSVSVTSASPGVVTLNSNKLNNGDPVFLTASGSMPSPLVSGTVYYVVAVATNTFEVSATKGGTAINTVSTGSGVSVTRMVRPMPIWKPKMIVMSAFGQQGAISANAETSVNYNWSDDFANSGASFDYGNGSSYKFGVNNRTMVIPPTLHGAITVSPTSQNVQPTVQVDASTNDFNSNAGVVIPAISNSLGPLTLAITGTVAPSSIAATTPAAVPTDGFYLAELNPQIHPDELVLLHVGIVDFSQLA